MNLEELIKETDALTYLNALRVTLTEIKEQFSEMEQQQSYMQNACEKTKKLIRRADGQYRLLTKIIQKDAPLTSEITVNDQLGSISSEDIQQLMENA